MGMDGNGWEWMGMDGNGGMGLSLIVVVDHSLIPYQAQVSHKTFVKNQRKQPLMRQGIIA